MQGEIASRLLRGFTGDAALAAQSHPLDLVVARLTRDSKIFSRGWGEESLLADLSEAAVHREGISPISVEWQTPRKRGRVERCDGTFVSPLNSLPEATRQVHLRCWSRPGNTTACVILAGSRDEGYTVRERVFGSLLNRGLDLYLLESPYYGRRRAGDIPPHVTVSDHGQLALGIVLEARALLKHLRDAGQKVVVAGYSMGGHMAAITAAVTPFAVGCAALATGASASTIYTSGLLSWTVDLEALGENSDGAAQQRLRQLFDAADVTHYPPPIRTEAAVIAGCTRDGYVFRAETERLHKHWPGSTLRWIEAGHFSALISSRRRLCDCVAEAAEKLSPVQAKLIPLNRMTHLAL
jgi:hypothetical protein